MDISPAALPPIQPHISKADREHPLFNEYMSYRSAMSRLLVEASSFQNWVGQKKMAELDDEIMKHPKFKEFQKWMWKTRGGSPGKTELKWPDNFLAWVDGARW